MLLPSKGDLKYNSLLLVSYFIFFIGLCAPIVLKSKLIEGYNSPRLLLFYLTVLVVLQLSKSLSLTLNQVILYFLFCAYCAYKLVLSYYALNFGEAINYLNITVAFFVALIVFQNVDYKNYVTQLFYFVSFGNIIGLAYLAYEWVWTEKDIYLIGSICSYKNILSAYFFLSVVLMIFFRSKGAKVKKMPFILLIGLDVMAAIWLEARASLLSYIVFFALLLLIKKAPKKYKVRFFASVAAIMTIITLYSIFNENLRSFDSLEERFEIWKNTALLIKDNPLWGVGPGNWQFEYLKYGVNDIYMVHQGFVSFQNTHNEFLQTLAENGILGLLILLTIFIFLFKEYKRSSLKGTHQGHILISGLLAFGIIAFFSFPLKRIILVLPIAYIIGLLSQTESGTESKISASPLKLILGLVCIVGVCFNIIRVNGEYHTKKLLEFKKEGEFKDMFLHTELAESVLYSTDIRSKPLSTYKGLYFQHLSKTNELLESTKKAYKLSPYDFEVLSNYGYALMKNGSTEQAKKILEKSFEINRHHDPTKLNMVTIHFNEKNYEAALNWLKKVLYFEKKHPQLLNRIEAKIDV